MIVNRRGVIPTTKPSKEEFDLVIEAIRYEYKNKPISLKTPTILGIAESFASKAKREGVFILLEIAKHSELNNIPAKNIISIIDWLRIVDKVIDDCSPRTHLPSNEPLTMPVSTHTDPTRFCLKIFDSFDNWHAAYAVKRDTKLENLSLLNLEKICYLIHDIEEKFELNPNKQIIIELTTGSISNFPLLKEKYLTTSDLIPYREEALEYLKNHDIISHYEIKYHEYAPHEVGMLLNVEEFVKFKGELKDIYLKKCNKSKDQKSHKNTIELPPNTKWQDILIEFKDGHNVDIKTKNKTIRADYKEMGFEDSKKRLPNQQWELLEQLAENSGELSWNDSEANIKLKKRKQLLSKALKAYFRIDEDPFFPYKQEKAYKIKINLIAA